MTEEVPIIIKHSGNVYTINSLQPNESIKDFKEFIYTLTRVRPENQKIMGLKAQPGKTISDNLLLSELNLKPNTKIMMMGSSDEVLVEINTVPDDIPEIIDDLDCEEFDIAIADNPLYKAKVDKRASQYEITVLKEPRADKKLLVLDIDYTIFDHLTPAESARHLMRPYLHEFLARAYFHYDIAVWSATGMTWIRAKLSEMGLLTSTGGDVGAAQGPAFEICMLLDSRAMITVDLPEIGVKEVKPLGVIWAKYSQWGPHNTIMFDDVRRNFVMNPQSGLRIKSYRNAPVNRQTDNELVRLADYLEAISSETDFCQLNHREWKDYLKNRKSKRKRTPAGTGTSNPADINRPSS